MKILACFSGLSAFCGLYLAVYARGAATRLIGAAVTLLGIASAALCFFLSRRKRKDLLRLQRQITDFLEGRIQTPSFSVSDSAFSMFENAVVELETRLLLEQKKALKKSRQHAEFVADISHQLKTPLAALRLYSEMDAEARSSSDASCEHRFDAPDSGGMRSATADNCHVRSGDHHEKQLALISHMENLIVSLLRFEKLQSDAYEMAFEAHSLAQITREACEPFQALYPEKSITIEGDASIRCDASWMGEAISNIVKNACEHTAPAGYVRIRIDQTDVSATLFVEDDGGGVAKKELSTLFRRFARVSSGTSPSTRTNAGGVGLGLSISRVIVEKHHGTIHAENAPQGLRVSMCFPVLDGVLSL